MKTLILLTFVLSSCVTTSSIPDDIARNIPSGASGIEVLSTYDDCYGTLYRHLAGLGYAFEQENAEMGTLKTAPKDIGQETTLSIIAYAEGLGSSCTIRLWGVWGVSQTMSAGLGGIAGGSGDKAKWTTGRPRLAFGELAVIADALQYLHIHYIE